MPPLLLAALPLALYLIWLLRARAKARAAGAPPPGFGEAPWGALLAVSALLIAVLLGGLSLTGGLAPQQPYQPPHLIDGRIAPAGPAAPPADPPRQSPRQTAE